MRIEAATAWLENHIDHSSWAARSSRTGEVDLSLERMRRFVGELGDPQSRLAVVHVTGTNGKGSTSRMISRLLMAEGLRVGTYSSPHLAGYTERFRIDDADIDTDTLAALLSRMADAEERLGDRLMPFEILTGAAFTLFADADVDVAVVEVGVLGRYDATNVADGRVAVITNIGFDHTNGDGDWQMRIAVEKAGIVKPGAQLVLGAVDARFDPAFTAEQPSAIWRLGEQIIVTHDEPTASGRRISLTTPWQSLADVELPLHGAHQTQNGALAITAASAFLGRTLDDRRARGGLAQVRMPARLEPFALGAAGDGPTVILDGAHNPDAARALADALTEIAGTGRRVLVLGLLAGRDPAAMLEAVHAERFDEIIVCTPPTTRARPAIDLATAAAGATVGVPVTAIEDISDALTIAVSRAAAGDQIIVTGSIYLVADARAWLLQR